MSSSTIFCETSIPCAHEPADRNKSKTNPNIFDTYCQLEELCTDNADFFKNDHTENGQRLYAAFLAWVDWIRLAKELVSPIELFAHEYDFDEHTPGNGYRSFVTVTNSCIEYGINICQNLVANRKTIFFRKKFYTKEVEACSQLLSSLCTCLQYLLILRQWSADGDLFASNEHSAEELFEMGDTINQYCFYGRCLGFQYGVSIRSVMRFISIGMASFSESFYSEDADGSIARATRSIWIGSKYFLNPELRAKRIVNISQNSKIDFCKSFWFLAESEPMNKIPSIVGSSIKVNKVIVIPSEPLFLSKACLETSKIPLLPQNDVNKSGDLNEVEIPVPLSHFGPGSISVRLLSYKRREGMIGEGTRSWQKVAPTSRSILFHCHGGGFVAQSSKSHEVYLRDWAVAIDTPVLSVDYSLAPQAPFPRALEEVFYAYCWMVKNHASLGTTAERIVLAGDSAGANLCIGIVLKCIHYEIRIPDGIFIAYCPVVVNFVPSPARMLCLMDPLLPFGFMMRCLKAYTSPTTETINENAKRLEKLDVIRNANNQNVSHNLDTVVANSENCSRRTSAEKSPVSSVADNSNWENLKACEIENGAKILAESFNDNSDTFASASYHSQTVERTDIISPGDNSSCVSFEEDSQPIVHIPLNSEITSSHVLQVGNTDSEQYVHRFLNMNTLKPKDNGFCKSGEEIYSNHYRRTFMKALAERASEENILIEVGKEIIACDSMHDRLNNVVRRISSTINKYITSSTIKSGVRTHEIQDLRNLDALIARSPSFEFGFNVPKDPFLSPYWASDECLSKFPNTKILTLDMDPCLDDCVMFAKKLKTLGTPVALQVLKGLPHGFLNFTMLSNEAMEGSKHCIECLTELLAIPAT